MRNVCPKRRKDYHQEVDVSYCSEGEGKGEEENDTRGRGEGRGRERYWGRGRGREKMILRTEGEGGSEIVFDWRRKNLPHKAFSDVVR